MKRMKSVVALMTAFFLSVPSGVFASSHREAPITALDRAADITDVYAFRSYGPSATTPKVTMILNVDPLLEPANGPTFFPFDKDILYEIKVDNDQDGLAEVTFQFRFSPPQYDLPNIPVGLAGFDGGIDGVVPPQITSIGFEIAGLPASGFDSISNFFDYFTAVPATGTISSFSAKLNGVSQTGEASSMAELTSNSNPYQHSIDVYQANSEIFSKTGGPLPAGFGTGAGGGSFDVYNSSFFDGARAGDASSFASADFVFNDQELPRCRRAQNWQCLFFQPPEFL